MVFLLTVMRIVANVAAGAVLGLAIYWSLRLGYADHLFRSGTPEGVKRAVELAPGNARYQDHWAAILEDSGKDPAAALAAMEAAVASNPRDSSSWMELGLRAERDGDLQKAERCLLEAARVDRQYDPRWTLANFYFRKSDWENFWLWAREAAAMSYGDSAALFRLGWRATQDPALILSRAIPDQPQVLARFIGFATYQLDSNLRNSTMVGIVGGGGIGATLFTAFQRFDYDYVLTILIAIIALIMIGEVLSGWIRRTFQ